jgi:hypothetical protein
MPKISAGDGTKLYCEEAGAGTPIVFFIHEFAGDYRTFEPLELTLLNQTRDGLTLSADILPR